MWTGGSLHVPELATRIGWVGGIGSLVILAFDNNRLSFGVYPEGSVGVSCPW